MLTFPCRLWISSAVLTIAFAAASTEPVTAGLAFVEDFQSSTLNSALEDPSAAFAVHDNAIWRNSSPYSSVDRAYIRTVYGDYAQHDFTAAVSFTVTNYSFPSPTDGPGSIVFFGLGSGSGTPTSEVNPALVFRAHSLDVSYGAAGRVDAVQVNGPIAPFPTGDGYDTYRVTASGLTHRAQITKAGDSLTFLFDENYNGTFAPDASYMISNLSTTAPWFFEPGNSHIFFGTATPIESFSHLAVVPEPSAASLVIIAGIAGIVLHSRSHQRVGRGADDCSSLGRS
jgi:hypothetical protein